MRAIKTIKISDSDVALITSKIEKILKCLKLKILIFTIIEIILILFFTYYIAAFCAVYKGTQNSWLLDSFVSFILTNLFEIALAFFSAFCYSLALKSKMECLYNVSLFIYDLGH